MEGNSIRNSITKEDIISNIRLTLSTDYHKKKIIMIVEGQDDIRFFKGKLSENVEIMESFSGKKGVEEIISEYDDNRVVGVCDKDYSIYERNERIFYYDYSCLEIMLIMNDDTWNSFFDEFYNGNYNRIELRNKIFNDLKWLSVFRKLNCQNSWGVNFNGYSIDNSYNETTEVFDNNKGFESLCKINSKSKDEMKTYRLDVDAESSCLVDIDKICEITQGHDFIFYFKCVCHHLGDYISKDMLVHALRAAYRMEDFSKSNIFKALNEYSQITNISILPFEHCLI